MSEPSEPNAYDGLSTTRFRVFLKADVTSGSPVCPIALPLCRGTVPAGGFQPAGGAQTAIIGGTPASPHPHATRRRGRA